VHFVLTEPGLEVAKVVAGQCAALETTATSACNAQDNCRDSLRMMGAPLSLKGSNQSGRKQRRSQVYVILIFAMPTGCWLVVCMRQPQYRSGRVVRITVLRIELRICIKSDLEFEDDTANVDVCSVRGARWCPAFVRSLRA